MEITRIELGDETYDVPLDGPSSPHAVLLLPDEGEDAGVFDAVCERLHSSDLRTVVPETVAGLTADSVIELLDQLKLSWVNLAGHGIGGDLAWLLAAHKFGRFGSLVVAGSPHPAVSRGGAEPIEPGCPAVEVPTTTIFGNAADDDGGSARRVYSDYRTVHLDSVVNIPRDAAAEFATEITLRTSLW
ncbi:MAG: alpha/beta hydrolase [Rhodococcus sp.]|nr:alpha/beta hydrolase [Rhodococcus sp. (in: high G+C Gram-positive bacteria)]